MNKLYFIIVTFASLSASATTLQFTEFASSQTLPSGYGDNITATTQSGFTYGDEFGFTPDVTLDFSANTRTWTTNYGDLTKVIWPQSSPGITITFTAAGDNLVRLHSLDIAGWSNTDYTINQLLIEDGSGNDLVSFQNLFVQGALDGTPRTSLNFATLPTAQILVLSFDASNTTFQNIGLDNIVFSQVPEPSFSSLIAGLSVICLSGRRV